MTAGMSQGDALATALLATMALMLASRAMGAMKISFKAKAAMAAAWLVLIVLATLLASQWSRYFT